MSEPDLLVLIGMMGAGKTTTAHALAERLGWPVRDCDAWLEERAGLTASQVAATDGVEELHRMEEAVLLDALTTPGPAVVTAAGSTIESPRVRITLKRHATVVWLDLPREELQVRMPTGAHRRPLEEEGVAELLARRRPLFAGVADIRLDPRRPTSELVDEVMQTVGARPSGGG